MTSLTLQEKSDLSGLLTHLSLPSMQWQCLRELNLFSVPMDSLLLDWRFPENSEPCFPALQTLGLSCSQDEANDRWDWLLCWLEVAAPNLTTISATHRFKSVLNINQITFPKRSKVRKLIVCHHDNVVVNSLGDTRIKLEYKACGRWIDASREHHHMQRSNIGVDAWNSQDDDSSSDDIMWKALFEDDWTFN